MTAKIAAIGGDGIGPEVTSAALETMHAAKADIEVTNFELGAQRYKDDGEVLSDQTIETLKTFDAILLGALGADPRDKEVPSGLIEREILLKLRFSLDHYVNLRPFFSKNKDVDIVFVREGTEGSYAGEGGVLRRGSAHEVATQGSVNTRFGVERVVRFAFELANSRPRKKLTLIHKTNVLVYSGSLWQRTFDDISKEYRSVEVDYNHVDAACIYLHDVPQRYDVIVTDNLFGDILTDLAGAVSGGIGLAASANLNPDRTYPSMFEPVHGSAPDIAGTGKANPMAAMLCSAMMLDFIGQPKIAAKIKEAVMQVAQSGLSNGNGTQAIKQAVIERL